MNHEGIDWDDRAIDAALQEVHGASPPDLSARVLLALHERAGGPLPRPLPRPRPWAGSAAAAMLLLSIATAVLYAASSGAGRPDPRLVQIEVAVCDGAVECVEATPAGQVVTAVARGATRLFTARRGNQLRNQQPAESQLGPFGRLVAGPATVLEVRTMEFTLKNGVVAASALTLSVVAGVATWHTLARTETAVAGEVVRMEAAMEAGALAAENARLKERLAELERQNETLTTAAARAAVPAPAAVEPSVAAPDAPVQPAAPAAAAPFSDARFDAALASIDWTLVGSVTHEMGPLLVELVKAMEETGDVPTELAIKIQELNQKLVAQVPAMLKAGMPGFGPNGAYTHPLVVANTLATTLQAGGVPLNDGQRAAIAGLVRSFSIENQGIADQSRDFELEHLLAETEMKDRFYREVATLLTPAQHAQMYPEGAAAYDGVGLFGTGLMLRPYTDAVSAGTASDFARAASGKLSENLGFDEATEAKVRAVVERVAAASPELWQDKGGKVEVSLRMLKAGRTPAALRRQIEIMREIHRQVPMSPEQRKKLASMKHVLVPLPR